MDARSPSIFLFLPFNELYFPTKVFMLLVRSFLPRIKCFQNLDDPNLSHNMLKAKIYEFFYETERFLERSLVLKCLLLYLLHYYIIIITILYIQFPHHVNDSLRRTIIKVYT